VPKAVRAGLAVLVALAAVVGVLLFVQSRDKSQVDGAEAAPGRLLPDQGSAHRRAPAGFRYASDPPASGPHLPAAIGHDRTALSNDQLLHGLELGDVALVYAGHEGQEQVLRGLQDDVSGPFEPALANTGQMVVLDRRPGTKGVIALAWRRMLSVPSVNDPRLRAFADGWLGRGVSGQ
jgi:Protein of unknown function (DUF3105)